MICILPLVFALALAGAAASALVDLKSAAPFSIVATAAITSTGPSTVNGLLGIYPNGATSITGFPPGQSGPVSAGDAKALAAHTDAMAAYTVAAALPFTTDLTGQDLGGMTLKKGVYHFSSSAQLTGGLVLDGANDPTSFWVFQMGSTLTTATAATVTLINQAQGCNVFWQVGSSATLGTSTSFVGSILASASVTANSDVTVQGGLYALSAAVTLIKDTITAPGNCAQSSLTPILNPILATPTSTKSTPSIPNYYSSPPTSTKSTSSIPNYYSSPPTSTKSTSSIPNYYSSPPTSTKSTSSIPNYSWTTSTKKSTSTACPTNTPPPCVKRCAQICQNNPNYLSGQPEVPASYDYSNWSE